MSLINIYEVLMQINFVPSLLIFAFYILITYKSYKNYMKIKNLNSNQKIGKIFFILIILSAIIFALEHLTISISSLIYSFNNIENIFFYGKIAVNLYIIPNMIIFLLFAFFVCQLICIMIYSRFELNLNDLIQTRNKLKLALKFICFINFIIFSLFFVLFNTGKLDYKAFFLIDMIFSIIPPVIIIFIEITLNCCLSGLPYKSLWEKKKKSVVNRVLVYWTFCRTFHSVIIFICDLLSKYVIIIKKIDGKNYIKINMVIIFYFIYYIDLIVNQVILFILIINKNFRKSFFTIDLLEISNIE